MKRGIQRQLENVFKNRKQVLRSMLCIGAGIVLYFAAEIVDSAESSVENGRIFRNPCGQGDAVYEIYVEELGNSVTVIVPEQRMTETEFQERIPEIADVLCEKILGENHSLGEVRTDLNLVTALESYGVTVEWQSERPEIISDMGIVDVANVKEESKILENQEDVETAFGVLVYLKATLKHGDWKEMVEIPVTVYSPEVTMEERFRLMLEELVIQEPERVEVVLPTEFEGQSLTYRTPEISQNYLLLLLGFIAAGCLLLKEKTDLETEKKHREEQLMEIYPDLISEFLILNSAGYSIKGAWKKMTADYGTSEKKRTNPLYEEMQMVANQMETGIPEIWAYAEFGKRCQLRCYVKFASFLETGISTGSKNMRKLLEQEVEEAFQQRMDRAKRKGEELSSKLLLPMFGMLGVVMVMVVAPAFLSFG